MAVSFKLSTVLGQTLLSLILHSTSFHFMLFFFFAFIIPLKIMYILQLLIISNGAVAPLLLHTLFRAEIALFVRFSFK